MFLRGSYSKVVKADELAPGLVPHRHDRTGELGGGDDLLDLLLQAFHVAGDRSILGCFSSCLFHALAELPCLGPKVNHSPCESLPFISLGNDLGRRKSLVERWCRAKGFGHAKLALG